MTYKLPKLALTGAACAALLCACATTPLPPPPPPPALVCPPPVAAIPVVVPDPQLTALLAYQARIHQQSPPDLSKSLQELNAQATSGTVALERAMVLAAFHNNGDLGRAQALAEGVLQSNDEEDQRLKPLAQSMAATYADARKQDETIDRLNQQLRDNQRRSDQLNDKLEALKNIERTLSGRPAPTAPPAK
jgi:uncharacterized coiled-coil protein SlyX